MKNKVISKLPHTVLQNVFEITLWRLWRCDAAKTLNIFEFY